MIISLSISKTKSDLEDINRERMLSGRLRDGQVLPHYSEISQSVYGYPNIPIALKDTGAFQEAIFVEVQGDKILTDSREIGRAHV